MVYLTFGACVGAVGTSHDARLVILSLIVAAVASFAALTFAARAQVARVEHRRAWLLVAAMALGGGIWTMHFVAMLAYQLPLAIAYDPGLTLLSAAIAVVAVAVGFNVVYRAQGHWSSWLVAGPIVGLGVAAMHYTGMHALRTPALVVYDVRLFLSSVAIAIVAATAALAIAWTVRGIRLRACAALLMAAAISGMHYTGMAGAQFLPDSTISVRADGVDRIMLGVWIAAAFLIGAGFSLVALWVEHRLALREASLLRRRDRRFYALAQHTTVLTLLVDADFFVRFEIGPTERLFGVKAGSMIGRRLTEVAPGIEQLVASLKSLATVGGGAILDRDLDLLHADGQRVILKVTMQDQREHSDLAGFLLQLHDVTDARRSSEALAAARDAAERGNRAKTEFLGNVSHELCTPIHVGNGYAQMLRDYADALAPEQVREYAEEICRSNDRLMQTVGDLIALSQLEADDAVLDEDPVELRVLLQLQARRLGAAAEAAGLTLEVHAERWPPILADERRLSYALNHLIKNAIKFSSAGAPIRLSATTRSDTGEIWVTVADRGVGMSAADVARAIESFTQIDGSHSRVAEGLGLGLAIARRVAERHGGRLDVTSTEGEGTRVSIVLPPSRVLNYVASVAA